MVDRLKQMIEYYGLNTSQFEKKIFSSNGSIRTVLNRGSGLNVSTVTRILENCPEISPDWLLLGKGEMLRQNLQNVPQIDPFNMVSLEKYEKKVEECALLRAELKSLKEQAARYAKEKTEYSGTISVVEV